METEIEAAPRTDFYLQLNSEADMPSALAAFYKQDYTIVTDPDTGETSDQVEGDPYLVMHTSGYAIHVIGIMYEKTGKTLVSTDGFDYAEQAAMDGWHINVRISGEEWREAVENVHATHGIEVTTPSTVWA